jgi:hypothetical protein
MSKFTRAAIAIVALAGIIFLKGGPGSAALAKQRAATTPAANLVSAAPLPAVQVLTGSASAGAVSSAKKGPAVAAGPQSRAMKLRRPRHQLEVRVIKPDGSEAVFHGVRERQARGHRNVPGHPQVIRLRQTQ